MGWIGCIDRPQTTALPSFCGSYAVKAYRMKMESIDSRPVGWGVFWILLCSPALAATPQGARDSISIKDLRPHVAFLASDTLEGRATGTQGGRAAAAYLAQQLRQAGLAPGVDGEDFLQPFSLRTSQSESQNLLGIVVGSDPELRNEVIVVSGHYDHVGYGNRTNSYGPFGQIHNGADDNASGTAAILEVAAAIASLDPPPRRTVLFALWDAEEGGMLGSKHWLKHPTVELTDVRLMVNCDMVGRLRNDTLVVYGSRTSPGLRRQLAEANVGSELLFDLDWRQRDDSDHWPFFRRGIPYVMLHTGDHADYHRPSDDVEKLNYDGLETLSQMLFEFVRTVADAVTSPSLRAKSREERPWHARQAEIVPAPREPRLGLSWNRDHQPGEPFVVTRVQAGSPAAAAGLQVGDRITSLAGQTAADTDTFVELVLRAPQQTVVEIQRDGASDLVTLPVSLRGNPVRIGVTWKEDDAEPGIAIVTTVVPSSPAFRAGVEPLDRLLPSPGIAPPDIVWLHDLAEQDEITLRRERRGQIEELVLQPLRPVE